MTILSTPVCIAKDDCYNENNGAYTVFYMWDGEKVFTEGGMYSGLAYDHYSVNATLEQIRSASVWFENNPVRSTRNNTYIGSTITLKRSRKAPNNTALKVVDYQEAYYDSVYNNRVNAKFLVTDGSNKWLVSANCLNEVLEVAIQYPFWYMSEQECNKQKQAFNNEILKSKLENTLIYETKIIIENLLASNGLAFDQITSIVNSVTLKIALLDSDSKCKQSKAYNDAYQAYKAI